MNEPNPNSDPEETVLVVSEIEDGERLDAFLVRHFPKFSRVKLQRSVAAGDVLVDGKKCRSSTRVRIGQRVAVVTPKAEPLGSLPEDIPLEVLYEDDDLVAINKPASMVVHPAKGHWAGTLTAALTFRFEKLSQLGGPTRPGIVHRLDRDTSGVILVAKTDHAHHALSSQFEKRTVAKEYLALVSPAPDRDRDLIDKPIGAHPYQREKKAIREGHSTSRSAQTTYEVLQRFAGFAVVAARPKTGRTHQIRVHLAHIGCPVLCDRLYSGRSRLVRSDLDRTDRDEELLLDRQALHAHRISFVHPVSSHPLTCEAPLPTDLQKTMEALNELRALEC